MKKGLIVILLFFVFVNFVYAEVCNLDVSLINQDPYPAIPGDYVKVVFQITGLSNPECGIVNFGFQEEFPFSLDPETPHSYSINSGTYERKYSSFYIAPFKLRVDQNALKGDNPLEVSLIGSGLEYLKEFDIYVEDSRADFEIYVKDYDFTTNNLNLEILNIEDVDVQALTLEIPKQENINIKGANKIVVGDLDSNEYTNANFEATLNEGTFTINILYTDSINVRRTLVKDISFDPSYFTDRNGATTKTSIWTYIFVLVIIVLIIWWIRKRIKKKKEREKRRV